MRLSPLLRHKAPLFNTPHSSGFEPAPATIKPHTLVYSLKKKEGILCSLPTYLYLCKVFSHVCIQSSSCGWVGTLHNKRRYWRFVFGSRNFHFQNCNLKQTQRWCPRECSISTSQVCRGFLCPHAHFRVYYILPTWVFDSVLFIAKVVEDLENEQAEEDTPSFLCG